MDVFDLRNHVVRDYADYVRSFLTIRDQRIAELVQREMQDGFLWPDPLVQLNPTFEPGPTLDALIADGVLHQECARIFCRKPARDTNEGPLRFHKHQVEGIEAARRGKNYVLTTGTGSGKSLSYIVPIVDHVLRRGTGRGTQAIIVYPMNALANSQLGELRKFLQHGYPQGRPPVTFERYTGQESSDERQRIIANPPDIILTNYVMLELVLTRHGSGEQKLVRAAEGLRFLVLDELHTYRGRQGADVAMLCRRVREACNAHDLLHVGTSATLSSGGTWQEQQAEVADVASRLFGATVEPDAVIGETLRRVTEPSNGGDAAFVDSLKTRIADDTPPATDTDAFLTDPLSRWIEGTLGLQAEPESGRLTRCRPRSLTGEGGAGAELAKLTGLSPDRCERIVREALLAGYRCKDAHGWPVFAFRLHQFVSKGESVYTTLEDEDVRHVTLQAQQYSPGSDRQKLLLPVAFCRECGQEYYLVRRGQDSEGRYRYLPRDLGERVADDDGDPGFLYINTADPWPKEAEDVMQRLPDDWIEVRSGAERVRDARRKRLPREVFVSPDGIEGAGTLRAHYMRAPFIFCPHCRVAYSAHQRSDFGKLATLGSEGRSTATTILTLSTIRELRGNPHLDREAQKLLSFTDNRQDASLQAGHFNDFVEIGLLRSALHRAVANAGDEGLRHDTLPLRVFDALDLPLRLYAANPEVEYLQLEETQRALRRVISYYLYRDLQRGWRVTQPNLEQCGLLRIDYLSLDAVSDDDGKWSEFHPALVTASAADRQKVLRVMLDFMRRELAIRVSCLQHTEQEGILQASAQYLMPPWALDPQEQMERGRLLYPCSSGAIQTREQAVFLSPRGGFGLYLKRRTTLPDYGVQLKTDDIEQIINQLLDVLTLAGITHRFAPRRDENVAGYKLNASAMVWKVGDGQSGFRDPIRVPHAPEEGHRANPFFVGFYGASASDLQELLAREHTAQVLAETRQEREDAFRNARLPILFCSPTMELGVDISQLNVVNMRNVPPTPANYAQRSGRAGRSGQPAFVYSYCSAGSPHDQYFFKRPEQMVAGAVTAPRLDLTNEDLVTAHVHAVWLAEVGLSLGTTLCDILDVTTDTPTLELQPLVRDALDNTAARQRAFGRAKSCIGSAIVEMMGSQEKADDWLHRILDGVPLAFEQACNRWRALYRAALDQSTRQQRYILDASRSPRDRERAKRLRNEAEAQLRLLMETDDIIQSDFYSYRYFASEGFLPGYNFPRLPLSAYLPGQRRRRGSRNNDEFITRPRFLAISEFGPRSFIYHEGARYVINKVILPVEGEETSIVGRASQCEACGYLHPLGDGPPPDLCEHCDAKLPVAMDNLFRMQNVSTRRRDRINSDEEERFRLGYEIRTGVRFAQRNGTSIERHATLAAADGRPLARLIYGHAATLWRMNMGWRRRRNQDQTGYVLDIERGFWAKSKDVTDEDPEDPLSARTMRVVPYVEDRRNCLLVEPAEPLDTTTMTSLEAALKNAIQVHFQLEDSEVAAEQLPNYDDAKLILLYEASEGGAGALRRLVEERDVLPAVARTALEICHYDADTGEDFGRPPRAREICEAACYDCLLSYYNQRNHRFLDRKALPDLLQAWIAGAVATSPAPMGRHEQLIRLGRLADSNLERKWLEAVDAFALRLPSTAQKLIESCQARPDFLYEDKGVAIFVDGPVHDDARRQQEDAEQQERLEDEGYAVVRFHHAADWAEIFGRYPSVFGSLERPASTPTPSRSSSIDAETGLDLDLFDDDWHPLLKAIVEEIGCAVEPGGDVSSGGRVVGQAAAIIGSSDRRIWLIDEGDPSCGRIKTALGSQGHASVLLSPAAANALDRIRAALEA
ncbi:MAG: DEAD/DEAH box helicase [Myxococcales bacterium]|nr:DEAD/DEAH box helicase [Myxococcales bacterium]